jgi:hypothetical protein
MNILTILYVIIFIILAGYTTGEYFLYAKSYSIIKKIALSYALGFGFIGIQMFILSILGIKWNYGIILTPWLIFICYFFLRNHKYSYHNLNILNKIKLFSRIEKLLLILLVSLLIFVGIESVLRPVQAWDGWDNWVFRANVFYLNKGIDNYYFSYTTDSYPLIIPLTTSLGYMSLGSIDDRSILLFYYFFYFALGLLFYSSIRNFADRKTALLFSVLLLSCQNLIRHGGRFEAGQADLAVGFYIFACVIVLLDYLKIKSTRLLLLLTVLLSIATQIKNDAIPFVLLSTCFVVYKILKEKKYKKLFYLIPLPLVMLGWELFKKFNNLHPNFLFRNGIEFHIERFPIIVFNFFKEFGNIQNWNIIWIVFLFCIVIYRKHLGTYILVPIFLFFQLLFYVFIFLLLPQDPVTQINAISNKLLLHIVPLAAFTITIVAVKVFKK